MLWLILIFLSYVVSLSCSDFTCEISIFILLFPQWKQNLILLEYQFEWGSAAGSGPSAAWTIQWIIWFIPGKWLISPGSRAVLLWLGLQLCVVFLWSFAVPQLEPTQACTPWLFINHRNSLATARRVWEKSLVSKFIPNSQTTLIPTSSFLPLSEFVFLSQLAVVSSAMPI